jgi:hypothetical protein
MTPDGRRAVSASSDKTLRLWDLESGHCLRTLEGHTSGVGSVSVTPDGRGAVSASYDKTLRLWDLDSGACLRTLEGHTSAVKSVRVTPNGRCAVSAGYDDKALRLWELHSGACLHILEGHTDRIESVRMTPGGHHAVTVGVDRTLRLWDLESGTCLAVVRAPAPLLTAAYGVCGPVAYVVAGTSSGAVLTYEARGLPASPPVASRVLYGSLPDPEEQLLRELEACRSHWGESHPNTLMARAALLDRQGMTEDAAGIRRRLMPRPTPLERYQQAREQYKSGDYAGVAATLEELLAEGFELPATHCHMARALLMLDREAEAREHVAEAWEHREEAKPWSLPSILARIHFFEILLAFLASDNAADAIAGLKRVVAAGGAQVDLMVDPVLSHTDSRLGADELDFLRALAGALNDPADLPILGQFPQWRDAGL